LKETFGEGFKIETGVAEVDPEVTKDSASAASNCAIIRAILHAPLRQQKLTNDDVVLISPDIIDGCVPSVNWTGVG